MAQEQPHVRSITPNYDVIIVGASFAGLAVASQLTGYRVLLIDRNLIGHNQTSACGTILAALQHWNATETVLQVHDHLVLHTAGRQFDFPSPYPWCTFDYRHLCELLFERSNAEFLQAAVQAYHSHSVRTSRGDFAAPVIVDASGWRAVLASSIVPGFASKDAMSFGIETISSRPSNGHASSTGLHFWYDSKVLPHGIGWIFPRGDNLSVGVGSYRGAVRLLPSLERFSERNGVHLNAVHGTYFPHSPRAPRAGKVFVVGDAAGMCLGLTGEGIRPALFFGETCGQTVRRILEGELSLEDGLAEYTQFVKTRAHFFHTFSTAQAILSRLPGWGIAFLASFLTRDPWRSWLFRMYWNLTREWEITRVNGSEVSISELTGYDDTSPWGIQESKS